MGDLVHAMLLATCGLAILLGVACLLALRRSLWQLPGRIAESVLGRMTPQQAEITQAVVNSVSLQALNLHFPVFLGGPSIDPFHARRLVDQLVVHPPRTILELGSGSSTVLISQVMTRVCDPGYRHIVVDHDPHFLAVTERYARLNGLADRIEFRLCPLATLPPQESRWYSGLQAILAGCRVDLLVIDGPPAFQAGREDARYPALPVLHPYLDTHCTILLDDANRPGERSVVERWLREYPDFTLTLLPDGKGLAVLSR